MNFRLSILYVADPAVSATFYGALLGCAPVEQSPTFAMFPLNDGTMLGLWRRDGVAPPVEGPAGGGELVFGVASRDDLQALHDDWTGRGLPILQAPTTMSFGDTFVAADPDGHRLRVMAPTGMDQPA